MSPGNLSNYLDFAVETAYLAGRLSLGFFQTELLAEFKPDDTPVTIADREVEKLIRGRIEKKYPNHNIVGEEFGLKETRDLGFRWIVDPIDGTKSFMRGIPLYAVLIGLEIEGEIEVGAAYFPALDEMIAAGTSMGCWWNGRRARVSPTNDLSRGVFSCTYSKSPDHLDRQATLKRLNNAFYHQVGWSDAYGYLLVATGRIELMLDPIMNAWDCAPFPPILREAGGYFGDWEGNPTIYRNEGMATSQILLPKVLDIINGAE